MTIREIMVADRDIICRTIAQGKNPLDSKVGDCMSTPRVTVTPEASLDECCRVLAENQIRRVVVVDEAGRLCGIVSQADLALRASPEIAAEVVGQVSMAAHG